MPRGDNRRRKIRNSELQEVARDLSTHFGGITVDRDVQGCWWNDDKRRMQCERNIRMTMVRNYTEPDGRTLMGRERACQTWENDVQKINELAEKIGRRFGQGAIFALTQEMEAAQVPGNYNENIDRSLVDWSFWRFGKISDKLKF